MNISCSQVLGGKRGQDEAQTRAKASSSGSRDGGVAGFSVWGWTGPEDTAERRCRERQHKERRRRRKSAGGERGVVFSEASLKPNR